MAWKCRPLLFGQTRLGLSSGSADWTCSFHIVDDGHVIARDLVQVIGQFRVLDGRNDVLSGSDDATCCANCNHCAERSAQWRQRGRYTG